MNPKYLAETNKSTLFLKCHIQINPSVLNLKVKSTREPQTRLVNHEPRKQNNSKTFITLQLAPNKIQLSTSKERLS